jgi:hypothetical protein
MSAAGLESCFVGFFAAFMSAASNANAHWYSVKCLSDGIPSLPDLQQPSMSLMVKFLHLCGIGMIQKKGRFVFSADKFKNFLSYICHNDVLSQQSSLFMSWTWHVRFLHAASSSNKSLPTTTAANQSHYDCYQHTNRKQQ